MAAPIGNKYAVGNFKPVKQKNKDKHQIISGNFLSETSNFKSGVIQISTKQLFFSALTRINNLGGLPNSGQDFRIVTKKNINSFDFILAVLSENVIEELIVAFYRIGKKTITELKELVNVGKIKKITFLVNDGFPKLVPAAYNLLTQYQNTNFIVKLENNHTKIICIRTENDFYVVEGSGNLSINARIEQYSFCNSKELYQFHEKWIKKL